MPGALPPSVAYTYAVEVGFDEARAAGAVGGKLLGAGGGGFMMLFVPPERQQAVRSKLTGLLHVPFKFEFSGSQIIFFDLEEDYAKHDKARSQQQIEAFREQNPDSPPASA